MTQELIFEPGPPRFKGCPPICERTNLPSFETEKDRSDFIKMNCSQVTLQWFCSHCKRYHFWSRSSPPDSLLRVLQLRHTIPESRSRPLAKKRAKAHTTNRSQRFYADKEQEENDGAKGEYAFSDATGYPVDENPYLHGDGHIDFTVNFREKMVTVDVKAARKPVYLFVKEKDIDVCSTVLVLAEVLGDEITFLGWATKKTMRGCPVRDFGYGIPNYYLPAGELRSMLDLFKEILPPIKL